MVHEVQRDLVFERILSNPSWVEHRWISPVLLDHAHAWARNHSCQKHHATRRPAFGNQRQVHTAGRVCDTDDISRVHTGIVEGIHDGLGMPGQALVSSAHLKSGCENALTTTLQFIVWDLTLSGNNNFYFAYQKNLFAAPLMYGLIK